MTIAPMQLCKNVNTHTSDFDQITFDQLCEMVEWPDSDISHITDKEAMKAAKLGLPAILVHLAASKTKEAVAAADQMTALWVDIDTHAPTIECLSMHLKALGIECFVIYSTANYTPSEPRWRVIIPLAEPITVDYWLKLQKVLITQLGGDTCALKPSQPLFAPSYGPGGYICHTESGEVLRPYE